MRQLLNRLPKAVIMFLGMLFLIGNAVAQQKAPTSGTLEAIPVTGTTENKGTFIGTLDVQKFATQNGQLVAVGVLKGTVTNTNGTSLGSVVQNVTLPVTNITGSCPILHLELGPLDLNLLGLRVQLNRIVLDITAQPGGGLLGDLLCALANLLNGGGPLSDIVNLLNQILGVLRGL